MEITVCRQLPLIRDSQTDGHLLRGRVSDSETGNEALHFWSCNVLASTRDTHKLIDSRRRLATPETPKPSCSQVWTCLWKSTLRICQRNMFSHGISTIRCIYKNALRCCWAISHRFSGEGEPFQHGTLLLVSAKGWLSDLWSLFSKHSWGEYETIMQINRCMPRPNNWILPPSTSRWL